MKNTTVYVCAHARVVCVVLLVLQSHKRAHMDGAPQKSAKEGWAFF